MLVFIHVLHFEVCHSIVTCSLLIRLTDNCDFDDQFHCNKKP